MGWEHPSSINSVERPSAFFMINILMEDVSQPTINSIETLNIPGMPAFGHDASCIMSVQERSARIMPENAIVTNKTIKKRIDFQISRAPPNISPPCSQSPASSLNFSRSSLSYRASDQTIDFVQPCFPLTWETVRLLSKEAWPRGPGALVNPRGDLLCWQFIDLSKSQMSNCKFQTNPNNQNSKIQTTP